VTAAAPGAAGGWTHPSLRWPREPACSGASCPGMRAAAGAVPGHLVGPRSAADFRLRVRGCSRVFGPRYAKPHSLGIRRRRWCRSKPQQPSGHHGATDHVVVVRRRHQAWSRAGRTANRLCSASGGRRLSWWEEQAFECTRVHRFAQRGRTGAELEDLPADARLMQQLGQRARNASREISPWPPLDRATPCRLRGRR